MSFGAAQVRELLRYNKRTGVLTWRVARGRVPAGARAGSWKKRYFYIGLFGKTYLVHRVIWLLVTGTWPKADIDHRDGDGSNNKFRNLRDASKAVNMRNRKRASKNNGTGYLGVSATGTGRFYARIKQGPKSKHLGHFNTPRAAHRAYVEARG